MLLSGAAMPACKLNVCVCRAGACLPLLVLACSAPFPLDPLPGVGDGCCNHQHAAFSIGVVIADLEVMPSTSESLGDSYRAVALCLCAAPQGCLFNDLVPHLFTTYFVIIITLA